MQLVSQDGNVVSLSSTGTISIENAQGAKFMAAPASNCCLAAGARTAGHAAATPTLSQSFKQAYLFL